MTNKIRKLLPIGTVVGALTIIGVAANNKQGSTQSLVRCGCGTEKIVGNSCLRRGSTKSCGCLRKSILPSLNKTHGAAGRNTKHPEYRIWAGIIQRCTNQKLAAYARYGGAGISICKEWREDFSKFLADVGARPSPSHSIDRFPNKYGNYEPGNVRWATALEQRHNRRDMKAPGCQWLYLAPRAVSP